MNAMTLATSLWFALQDGEEVKALKQVTEGIDKTTTKYFLEISGKQYPASEGLYKQAISHGAIPDTLPKQYKINQVTFQI